MIYSFFPSNEPPLRLLSRGVPVHSPLALSGLGRIVPIFRQQPKGQPDERATRQRNIWMVYRTNMNHVGYIGILTNLISMIFIDIWVYLNGGFTSCQIHNGDLALGRPGQRSDECSNLGGKDVSYRNQTWQWNIPKLPEGLLDRQVEDFPLPLWIFGGSKHSLTITAATINSGHWAGHSWYKGSEQSSSPSTFLGSKTYQLKCSRDIVWPRFERKKQKSDGPLISLNTLW